MTNVMTQAASIPAEKLELLTAQLLLLKSSIDAISGRLEILLTEIAELHRDNAVVAACAIDPVEPLPVDQIDAIDPTSVEAPGLPETTLPVTDAHVSLVTDVLAETAVQLPTPLVPKDEPCTAVVLHLPSPAAMQKHRPSNCTIRTIGRWAAAAAAIAFVSAIGATGSGSAGTRKFISATVSCLEEPALCSILSGIPF
jgi:hypothetical protein